jgi:DNA polymerase
VDLRSTGVYPYAQHEHTDIWCMAWAFDDEEPEIWTPEHELPLRVFQHIHSNGEIRAWNAAFERVIWNNIMVPRYGAPEVIMDQWVCSAAEAAAMSLPRSLDQCATVTGVAQQKDQDGYGLMMRMTRPRKILEDGTPVWWDVEDRKQRLFAYCKQDVRTERAIVKVLRRLTPHEREIYLLDQRINDRGIYLDRELCLAAKDVAEEGLDRANLVLEQLTGGRATEVTKIGAIKGWLADQGAIEPGDSLDKAAVRDLLESDLAPEVRQVIELRAEAGRTSIAKVDSMLECACEDDRIRGLLLYHGAGTGRWSGRLVQPQNFPRGEVDNIESFIPEMLGRRYDLMDLFAHPIVVISSMLRSMITAAPGNDLIAADYSAIEARVLNWLAGQNDMVELFRKFDAAPKAEKPQYDPYRINAARLYNIPLDQVLKFPHRQTGKFQELGCGYGMGWKKALTQAKDTYGLDLVAMLGSLEKAEAFIKLAVESYRESHDKVVEFWNESNNAAIEAVLKPGSVVRFGALKNLIFTCQGSYLYLILPAKRPLCYAAPKVVDAATPWGEIRPSVECWGVNSVTRKWDKMRLYGGLIVENIVQAVSRDLMADGMLKLDTNGYPVVLTVHDEIVSEVPKDFGSLAEFEQHLNTLPEWAAGCPIATEGWRGLRYRK